MYGENPPDTTNASFNTEATSPFPYTPGSPGSDSSMMDAEPQDVDDEYKLRWNRAVRAARRSNAKLTDAHNQCSRYFNLPLLDRTGLCDTAISTASKYPRNERNAIVAYAATRPLMLDRFDVAQQNRCMRSLYSFIQADQALESGTSGEARVNALMQNMLSQGNVGIQVWRDIFEEELSVASASWLSDEA